MDVSLFEFLAGSFAVFLGAILQGVAGFGLAVIAAPILYFFLPAMVPSSLICIGLLIALLHLKTHFKGVELGKMKYAMIGRVPGSMIGAWLLTVASSQNMSLFMGSTILMVVAASLSKNNLKASKASLMTAGIISGITGTTSSIGGPPVALVMQNEPADSVRANLALFFIFSNCISILILALSGLFTLSHLVFSLMMMPAIYLGSSVALYLQKFIDQQRLKNIVLMICALTGISTIATGLMVF